MITQRTDRDRFIHEEFECFVRIGSSSASRPRILHTLESILTAGMAHMTQVTFTAEVHDDDGALREVWVLETDGDQVTRLYDFLTRFSVPDVQMIARMLRHPITE